MNFSKKPLAYVFLAILILTIGCSGNGTPVTPENSSNFSNDPILTPDINLPDGKDVYSSMGILGAFSITVDYDKLTAELVPKRNITVGESFIVSGGAFFTVAPCPNCLTLDGLHLDSNGNLVLDLRVSHPFAKGDTSKPPTAANRLDLDVFDLAAVVHPLSETPTHYTLLGDDLFIAT